MSLVNKLIAMGRTGIWRLSRKLHIDTKMPILTLLRRSTRVQPFSSNGSAGKDTSSPKDEKYGGLGGISTDIFNRICETMFTRVVLGLQIERAEKPGRLLVHMPLYDFNDRDRGPTSVNNAIVGDRSTNQVHSGVLAALMDHCGGLCAWTLLTKPSQLVSTVDLQVDYVKPVPVRYFSAATDGCNDGRPTIYCEANAVSSNEKFIICDISIYESVEKKTVYATARGLYNIYTSPITKLHIPLLSNIPGFKKYVNPETVTSSLPAWLTANLVRWIESIVVLRLYIFPKEYKLLQRGNAEVLESIASHDEARRNLVFNTIYRIHHKIGLLSGLTQLGMSIRFKREWNARFFFNCECNIRGNSFINEVLDLRLAYISSPALSSTEIKLVTVLPFKKRFVGNFFIPCVHGGVTAAVLEYTGQLCAMLAVKQYCQKNKITYHVPEQTVDIIDVIPEVKDEEEGPYKSVRLPKLNFSLNAEVMKVNYLKPTPCEHLICEATVSDYDHEAGCAFVNMSMYESTYTEKLSVGSGIYRVKFPS
jgi:acyl-coenzyme A thioesterase PaaI-like protein